MAKFRIEYVESESLLNVGFGDEVAESPEILKEANAIIEELIELKQIKGAELIKISGAMTTGVAAMLGKKLGAFFSAIAIFDPKLGQFYILHSTHPNYRVGDRLVNEDESLPENPEPDTFLPPYEE